MPKRVLIFGLGAQTKYILETFKQSGDYQVEAILVPNHLLPNEPHFVGVPVLSWDGNSLNYPELAGVTRALVIDSNNQKKAMLMDKIKALGLELVSAIHPRASIAATAQLGENLVINTQAVIQPFARVGKGVMIHAGAIIEHDNVIEDFVNLAPGATLAGWVRVQEGAYIYTNATIIPQRVIGKHAIVGAGAVVLKDVPDYAVAVGNPARIIKYRSPQEDFTLFEY